MAQLHRSPHQPGHPQVRRSDRWLDAAALLTLATGVLLFSVGRSSLTALAGNAYRPPPDGVTWVSRAELHDAQTRWGSGLAIAGLILALGASVKHTAAKRRRVD
jgi:hypothetical protein